jgi:signal transduction histidine kinase
MDNDISQVSFLLTVITGVLLLLLLLVINLMLNSRNSRLRHHAEMLQLQSQTREAISAVRVEVAEATLDDVSRDLHDEVGQLLTFSILQLENLTSRPEEEQQHMLGEIKKSVRDSMDSIRRISRGLNPDFINQQGLIKALEQLLERAHTRTGIKTSMQVPPDFAIHNPSIQIIIFRILRECLTNSLRHGKASRINLGLTSSQKWIEISFFDNGVGTNELPDAIPSLGWKNIQHYISLVKGKVTFISGTEKATEVILYIPNQDT